MFFIWYTFRMLILYTRPSCAYSHRVLQAAEPLGLSFEEKDIGEEENRLELIERGGKQQVPYLVDDERNVEMYESEDIVAYLEEQYSQK